MRIAFINANLSGDFSAADIALTVLATQVNERSRHSASICDLTFHRQNWQEHLRRYVLAARPDAFGLSLNNLHLSYAEVVARYLHQNHPGVPIIAGGHEASVMENRPDWIDCLVRGDGEEVLPELLDHLNRLPPEICQPFRSDLDTLGVPDWTLWADLRSYFYFLGGMLYVLGSRGCPHRCSFCTAPEIQRKVEGSYFRQRDPVSFVKELAVQEHRHTVDGLRFFQIFDPVFTIDADWVDTFCACYRTQCHLPFSVFARLDQLDERRVKALARAGCKIIRVGIEHGDERIRNEVLEKNVSDTQVKEAVALCHQAGINLTGYYILGVPGETHRTIRKTISLSRELACARSVFFVYKPFTKAGLAQVARFGGHVIGGVQPDNITFGVAIQPSPHLSAKQVEWYQRWAYLLTFGPRWVKTVRRDGWRYFWELGWYVARGLRRGLSLRYLFTYFQVYAGRNVYE